MNRNVDELYAECRFLLGDTDAIKPFLPKLWDVDVSEFGDVSIRMLDADGDVMSKIEFSGSCGRMLISRTKGTLLDVIRYAEENNGCWPG